MGTYVLYLKLVGKAVLLAAGFLFFVMFWRNLGIDLLDPDNPVACLLFNPWLSVPVILIAGPALYYVHAYNDKVGGKIDALKGAAFDLVRMMETTIDGTEKKHEKLNAIAEKFAIDGAAKVAEAFCCGTGTTRKPAEETAAAPAGTAGYSSSHQITLPDFIKFADELRKHRQEDMVSFGGTNTNVRTGLQVFLMLMTHDNIQSAFIHLTEHMKKQVDAKGAPNFPELKAFFGLPVTLPDADTVKKLQADGLNWYEWQACNSALKRGRKDILAMLTFNPPTEGKPAIVIRGEDVLKSMRTFLYSAAAATYNPSLAS